MFTEHILWVVRLYSLNEMNMNSVERIRDYLQVDSEAARRSLPGHEPPKDWPQKGAVKVEKLTLRYAPDLPTVIRNVSFEVEPRLLWWDEQEQVKVQSQLHSSAFWRRIVEGL